MAQTTPTPTTTSLDKFYTRPQTAELCLALLADRLPGFSADLHVEPAAGDGAFLDRLPEPRFGLDIAPAGPGMETGDFLDWAPEEGLGTVAVIGNPPFGRNAAKAIAFFNHAAGFAEVIAMILPASLMKGSMQDRLDDRFHLVDEMPLLAEPFRVGETLREVNAVFQIWRREPSRRAKSVRKTRHADFRFVATAAEADFVIRRVGGRAGAILPRPDAAATARGYSPSSNLFVKAAGVDRHVLEARFGALDFGEVRHCVAANPSVSKSDIVALYEAQRDLERLSRAAAQGDAPVAMPAVASHLVAPALAEEGDLVAMIVHHRGTDRAETAPPAEVEFRWRQGAGFEPVLHTALRGKRRRQAMRLLEALFAGQGVWTLPADPRPRTSILFRGAIVRLGAPGAPVSIRDVELAPSESNARRAERARDYLALARAWLGATAARPARSSVSADP